MNKQYTNSREPGEFEDGVTVEVEDGMRITKEAVEAGAQAYRDITFDALTMDECRDAVRAALEAALPHLSQEVVGVKDKVGPLRSLVFPLLYAGDQFGAFDRTMSADTTEEDVRHQWRLIRRKWDAVRNAAHETLASHKPAPTDAQEGFSEAMKARVIGWQGYLPGAGSINSETNLTKSEYRAKQWEKDGATVTPLVTLASLLACQQEVETLRKGIKEIAEREQSIRDNWTRNEAETGARILELETDLEIANDLIRKKNKALRNIRELNFTRPGADGLRWARSDLIEQEIVFGLGGQSND